MALRFVVGCLVQRREKFPASSLVRHLASARTKKDEGSSAPEVPEMPRKPLTAYLQFVTQQMPRINADMPNTPSKERLVEAARRWKNMSDLEKKPYNQMYTTAKAQYDSQMVLYRSQLSQDQLTAAVNQRRQEAEKRKLAREQRQRRREFADNDRPRRPANAFILFKAKHQQKRDAATSQKDFTREVAEQWKSLPEGDKFPYVQRATALMSEYKERMVQWENKMIDEGRTDLVRVNSQPLVGRMEGEGRRRKEGRHSQ